MSWWPWSLARTARNLWVLVILLSIIALPLCIWELIRKGAEYHVIAWFVAGVFCLLAVPISVGEVVLHLYSWTNPRLQKYVVRILWMVPIYAIDAWLALRFKEAAIYLDTIRDCYEAYVIYTFTFFLIASLGDERTINQTLSEKPPQPHLWPFKYFLSPWRMDGQFLSRCKHGVLSYTVVKLLITFISFWLVWSNKMGEGVLDFSKGYVYIAFINSCSQTWAMYCLILFYKANQDALAHIKPVRKLLCVKAIVFFSFWQSCAIAVLVHVDFISQDQQWTSYSVESVATGLQEFLICVEMFFAAFAHMYAFSHHEYKDPEKQKQSIWQNLGEMFDVADVGEDVFGHLSEVANSVHGSVLEVADNVKKGVKKVVSPGTSHGTYALLTNESEGHNHKRSPNRANKKTDHSEADAAEFIELQVSKPSETKDTDSQQGRGGDSYARRTLHSEPSTAPLSRAAPLPVYVIAPAATLSQADSISITLGSPIKSGTGTEDDREHAYDADAELETKSLLRADSGHG